MSIKSPAKVYEDFSKFHAQVTLITAKLCHGLALSSLYQSSWLFFDRIMKTMGIIYDFTGFFKWTRKSLDFFEKSP